MSQELVQFHRAVVRVFEREQALPRIFQLLAEVDAEQFLVAIHSLFIEEAIPHIVQVAVDVDDAALWQRFLQLIVRAVAVRLYDGVRRFVSEEDVAVHKRIAREIETVFHPPSARLITVVIAAHQNFSTGQKSENVVHVALRTYRNVADVNHEISRLDRLIPVLDGQFREAFRTLAVRLQSQMIKVRVTYHVDAHVLGLLNPVVVPIPYFYHGATINGSSVMVYVSNSLTHVNFVPFQSKDLEA